MPPDKFNGRNRTWNAGINKRRDEGFKIVEVLFSSGMECSAILHEMQKDYPTGGWTLKRIYAIVSRLKDKQASPGAQGCNKDSSVK